MSRPKLIFGSPETCADLLYATHFRAPDAFAYLEVEGNLPEDDAVGFEGFVTQPTGFAVHDP